jgi:enoyl-CoA hydratase
MGDALFMLTTGEMLTAADALRIGLVQKVTEPEMLMEEVFRIAGVIAAKGPDAVKMVKFVTRQGYQVSLAQGSQLEAQSFGQLFGKQGTEGMKAFLEKRKPQW